ncbi:MAG: hypothetical protein HY974_04465 [Candidatus Kerfeldbacteria bacterium]|nr:hypothetical protein [Candidatus Kerfeldbacteria bacterium]
MYLPHFVKHLFGDIQLEPLEGGYNSEVTLISHPHHLVVKLFGGKKGIDLTPDGAVTLAMQIARYRTLLHQAGIIVPDFLDWAISRDELDGKMYLAVVEPYCGVNTAQVLRGATTTEEGMRVLRGILDAIAPLLTAISSIEHPQVGIDPKPENFTNGGSPYTFIDFMPPRFREGDTYLVEYPQPTTELGYTLGKWKHFTVQGICTILLTQLARIHPKYFELFRAEISTWLEVNGHGSECSYFVGLGRVDREYIAQLENPYEMRLVMCALASRNGASPPLVDQFFRLTHFEDKLTDHVVSEALRILLTYHDKVLS